MQLNLERGQDVWTSTSQKKIKWALENKHGWDESGYDSSNSQTHEKVLAIIRY